MIKKFFSSKKDALNEEAVNLAIRDNQMIEYDTEHPLVINDMTKIIGLYLQEDDDEFEGAQKIRVAFKDDVFNYEKHAREEEPNPYVVDIYTRLPLSEFEKRLQKCKNEEEIENLFD